MGIERIAAYFDSRAPQWDAQQIGAEENARKTTGVAWIAGVRSGSRVLDLGCGTGVMAPAYLDAGAQSIVGIDASLGMIECARQKFADEPRISFVHGDVLEYVTDQLFDVVVIYNAYPHFLEKERLVEHVAQLLVPGGRFLVAHGMGRATLNAHHANVPADITSDLEPAALSCEVWRTRFDIDCLVDTPHCYLFGGSLK